MSFCILKHRRSALAKNYKNFDELFEEIDSFRDYYEKLECQDNQSPKFVRAINRATERLFVLMVGEVINLLKIYLDVGISEILWGDDIKSLGILIGNGVSDDIAEKLITKRNSLAHEYQQPLSAPDLLKELNIWEKRIRKIQERLQFATICPYCGIVLRTENPLDIGSSVSCPKCETNTHVISSSPLIFDHSWEQELTFKKTG